MTDPSLIADLIRAGLDPELVGRVSNALLSAKSADSPVDKTTEKRRAYDRERRRIERMSGEHPPTSAESADTPLTIEDSKIEKKERARATRLSADWKPTQPDLEFAFSKGMFSPRLDTEADKFRNYWTAKSGAAATKLDWSATWRNWVLSSLERAPGAPTTAPPNGSKPAYLTPPPGCESLEEFRERFNAAKPKVRDA